MEGCFEAKEEPNPFPVENPFGTMRNLFFTCFPRGPAFLGIKGCFFESTSKDVLMESWQSTLEKIAPKLSFLLSKC